MEKIEPVLGYLLGLISGRGHLFASNNTIAIEFSHKNEFVYGIAYCPKCGWIATEKNKILKCKKPSCGFQLVTNPKKSYNQIDLTKNSLSDTIIPFLKTGFNFSSKIYGNKTMTILALEFEPDVFSMIQQNFNTTSFDSIHIPQIIYSALKEVQIEYINGLLDTAGFASTGGWLNRDGENGHARMRVYFQFVRNWYLPVEVDNFLRNKFNLPIHTIDWGHPNIRDSKLEDYYNSNPTSWSREHQLKFFPEYYCIFKFRIESKRLLFQELLDHNLNVGFDKRDDWYPPRKFGINKVKPSHPGENDIRLPLAVRKHFDAFWQLNLALGCEYLNKLKDQAVDPSSFEFNGTSDLELDLNKLAEEYKVKREKLFDEIANKYSNFTKKVNTNKYLGKNEKALYAPIVIATHQYLSNKYGGEIEVFDTSQVKLNLFMQKGKESLVSLFENYERLRIRPDVVGFVINISGGVFVEAKDVPLDLKSLGQILGYSLVAQPVEAILISPYQPSISFIKAITGNPEILNYGKNRRVKVATWENNNIKFINNG